MLDDPDLGNGYAGQAVQWVWIRNVLLNQHGQLRRRGERRQTSLRILPGLCERRPFSSATTVRVPLRLRIYSSGFQRFERSPARPAAP
jgi:hypothetical protein